MGIRKRGTCSALWMAEPISIGKTKEGIEPGAPGSNARTMASGSRRTQSLPSCPEKGMVWLPGQHRVQGRHAPLFLARQAIRNVAQGVDVHPRILAAPLQWA